MKAFKCDECDNFEIGLPIRIIGDLCGPCRRRTNSILDAANEPDPEPQLPPGNWISVKDGLPANDKAVHAIYGGGVYDGNTVWVVRYHGGNSERDAHWLWEDRSTFHGTGRISHWRPIRTPAPEPEPKPRPEQGEVLATILRSVADEIERRGVARFTITDKREQVETTLGLGYPRTFERGMGQTMTLSWNWEIAKED